MMNYYGYPMGMYGMGAMGAGNVNRYYKAKYGCEDCLIGRPYFQTIEKPMINMAKEDFNPGFFKRLFKRLGF